MIAKLASGHVLLEKMFRPTKVAVSEKTVSESSGVYRIVDGGDSGYRNGEYVIVNHSHINIATYFSSMLTGDIYGIFNANAILAVYNKEESDAIAREFTSTYQQMIANPKQRGSIFLDTEAKA